MIHMDFIPSETKFYYYSTIIYKDIEALKRVNF